MQTIQAFSLVYMYQSIFVPIIVFAELFSSVLFKIYKRFNFSV